MEPIRRWYKDYMEKRQANSELLQGLQNITDAIINGNKNRPNKLIKLAKVSSWSKGIKLEAYERCNNKWE